MKIGKVLTISIFTFALSGLAQPGWSMPRLGTTAQTAAVQRAMENLEEAKGMEVFADDAEKNLVYLAPPRSQVQAPRYTLEDEPYCERLRQLYELTFKVPEKDHAVAKGFYTPFYNLTHLIPSQQKEVDDKLKALSYEIERHKKDNRDLTRLMISLLCAKKYWSRQRKAYKLKKTTIGKPIWG